MIRGWCILELLRSLCGLATAVCDRPSPQHRFRPRSPGFGDPPECGEPEAIALWDSLVQVSADVSSERAGLLRGEKYVSTLTNFGTEYVMDMTIAGHTLQAIPDTGSFDIVIPRAAALPCAEPSCRVDSSEVYLKYGSGEVWAYTANADVSIGTLSSSNQSFLLGHRTTIEDIGETFEVVAGIGPPTGGHELLVQLGVQYVSACLPLQGSGKLIWNDTPRGTSMPIAGKHHWAVQMTTAMLEGPGGTHPLGCNGMGCAAIMDTGTSLISAPSSVLTEIEKGLNKLGGDCDHIDQVASIKFKLGGHEVKLPPESFIGYINNGFHVECGILIMDSGEIDTDMGHLWILGMPFFSAYHTTFDLGSPGGTDKANMRIHMTPTGGSCAPNSRTSEGGKKLREIDWKKVRTPAWLRSAKQEATRGNFTLAL